MKRVLCTNLGVDCVINDPVDVRAGGTQYLGFDFNVRQEEVDAMMEFIPTALKEYGVPLIRITKNTEGIEVVESKVWTRERIVDCIEDQSEMLIHEASRNYKLYVK